MIKKAFGHNATQKSQKKTHAFFFLIFEATTRNPQTLNLFFLNKKKIVLKKTGQD